MSRKPSIRSWTSVCRYNFGLPQIRSGFHGVCGYESPPLPSYAYDRTWWWFQSQFSPIFKNLWNRDVQTPCNEAISRVIQYCQGSRGKQPSTSEVASLQQGKWVYRYWNKIAFTTLPKVLNFTHPWSAIHEGCKLGQHKSESPLQATQSNDEIWWNYGCGSTTTLAPGRLSLVVLSVRLQW